MFDVAGVFAGMFVLAAFASPSTVVTRSKSAAGVAAGCGRNPHLGTFEAGPGVPALWCERIGLGRKHEENVPDTLAVALGALALMSGSALAQSK